MEIFNCDRCGRRVTEMEIERGEGAWLDGDVFCKVCLSKDAGLKARLQGSQQEEPQQPPAASTGLHKAPSSGALRRQRAARQSTRRSTRLQLQTAVVPDQDVRTGISATTVAIAAILVAAVLAGALVFLGGGAGRRRSRPVSTGSVDTNQAGNDGTSDTGGDTGTTAEADAGTGTVSSQVTDSGAAASGMTASGASGTSVEPAGGNSGSSAPGSSGTAAKVIFLRTYRNSFEQNDEYDMEGWSEGEEAYDGARAIQAGGTGRVVMRPGVSAGAAFSLALACTTSDFAGIVVDIETTSGSATSEKVFLSPGDWRALILEDKDFKGNAGGIIKEVRISGDNPADAGLLLDDVRLFSGRDRRRITALYPIKESSQAGPEPAATPPMFPVSSTAAIAPPDGAAYFLGFESEEDLSWLALPVREFTSGPVGRAAGITSEGDAGYRLSLRHKEGSTIAPIGGDSVVVFAVRCKDKPGKVWAEIETVDQPVKFTMGKTWNQQVGTGWEYRGFRISRMFFGGGRNAGGLPPGIGANWFDFRSEDGPFYIDNFAVFPGGDVDERIAEVKAWAEKISQPKPATAAVPIPAFSPEGAVLFVGFEPSEEVEKWLRRPPQEYTDGMPGRAAGVTRSDERNYRVSIRDNNENSLARLTPGAVIVFAVRGKEEGPEVWFELTSEAPGVLILRANGEPVEEEWTFRGFRLGDIDISSDSGVRSIPESFEANWLDFRSKEGPFYIDSLTVFPDGEVAERIAQVKSWTGSAAAERPTAGIPIPQEPDTGLKPGTSIDVDDGTVEIVFAEDFNNPETDFAGGGVSAPGEEEPENESPFFSAAPSSHRRYRFACALGGPNDVLFEAQSSHYLCFRYWFDGPGSVVITMLNRSKRTTLSSKIDAPVKKEWTPVVMSLSEFEPGIGGAAKKFEQGDKAARLRIYAGISRYGGRFHIDDLMLLKGKQETVWNFFREPALYLKRASMAGATADITTGIPSTTAAAVVPPRPVAPWVVARLEFDAPVAQKMSFSTSAQGATALIDTARPVSGGGTLTVSQPASVDTSARYVVISPVHQLDISESGSVAFVASFTGMADSLKIQFGLRRNGENSVEALLDNGGIRIQSGSPRQYWAPLKAGTSVDAAGPGSELVFYYDAGNECIQAFTVRLDEVRFIRKGLRRILDFEGTGDYFRKCSDDGNGLVRVTSDESFSGFRSVELKPRTPGSTASADLFFRTPLDLKGVRNTYMTVKNAGPREVLMSLQACSDRGRWDFFMVPHGGQAYDFVRVPPGGWQTYTLSSSFSHSQRCLAERPPTEQFVLRIVDGPEGSVVYLDDVYVEW